MSSRGWYVQAQLGYRGLPASIHLTLTASSDQHVDALLADLADSVATARAATTGLDPSLREAVAALDPDELPDDVLGTLLPMAGLEPAPACPSGWPASTPCSRRCRRGCASACWSPSSACCSRPAPAD
jgi:hypothetical protein